MVIRNIKTQIRRYWPDLPNTPTAKILAQEETGWTPGKGLSLLEHEFYEGSVIGQAIAKSWRHNDRVYIQVQGPESPDVDENSIFCEAVYSGGDSSKIEQYSYSRAIIVWQFNGQVTAHSAVSPTRYRTRFQSGQVELIFWTPEQNLPESLAFLCHEADQVGKIMFRFPAPK